MGTPKEKFDAAVRVIASLPKEGSFKPSNELLLRFYSLYKQATQGPCRQPRPGFWDLVSRAKWDAWHALGDMRSETAMLEYVDELKKVIETMPHTADVEKFLETIGNFYEVVVDGDAAAASGTADAANAAAATDSVDAAVDTFAIDEPENSSELSEDSASDEVVDDDGEGGPMTQFRHQDPPPTNGTLAASPDDEEGDEEEFCDTVEPAASAAAAAAAAPGGPADAAAAAAVALRRPAAGAAAGPSQLAPHHLPSPSQIKRQQQQQQHQHLDDALQESRHIRTSLARLQADLDRVHQRLDGLEESSSAAAAAADGTGSWQRRLFGSLPPATLALLLLWPVLLQLLPRVTVIWRLLRMLLMRRQRRR